MSTARIVAISIRSEAAGWASRTLAEVEEQVERTRVTHWPPILALIGILVVGLLVLASQFVAIRDEPAALDVVRMMWLRDQDLDRVEAIVRQQRMVTDQEMREVFTMQLRNVLDAARPHRSVQVIHTRQRFLLAISLAVVVGCTAFLLFTCYPMAVFLWGDEVDRHTRVLQRRRILWGVVVGIALVGMLSKFLYEGVAPWLPRE